MSLPKVSVVKYLNTVPLIWGMLKGKQQGKYHLDFTTPAACADALRRSEADLGIIPSIEYQRIGHLAVLPGLSIASKNQVKSVLLVSKTPISQVQTVAADTSSRTSVALLDILLRKFYSLNVRMTPAAPNPREMLERSDAALIIGDPALALNGQAPQIYDLAAEWKKFTGLPFVFAVWAGREGAEISRYRDDFEASRDYGLAHMDDIAQEYGPKVSMTPEAVKVYLTENIDYSLDDENLEGLRLFYRLAHELGLVSQAQELCFA